MISYACLLVLTKRATSKIEQVPNRKARVGKSAEIGHDPEVQAIKPKSKLIPALDVAVEADAPSKKKSVTTSTKDVDKDPGAVEGANKSVATSIDVTRYSSSPGNDAELSCMALVASASAARLTTGMSFGLGLMT